MKRQFRWDKKYLYWGITAFCVVAASILFYFILKKLPALGQGLDKLLAILSPFVWGLILTYLMAPLMKKLDKHMPRWVAALICEIALLLIIAALIYLVIPQLYSSLETIVSSSPAYYEKMMSWATALMKNNPDLEGRLTALVGDFNNGIVDLIKTKLLPSLGNVVSNVTTGVVYAVKALVNGIIGIIVSAYVLMKYETVGAGGRKLLYSIFTVPAAEKIRKGIGFIDKVFMNYLEGNLLDSLIIGIICYLFCEIVAMPYTLLVSVIVGVTNIIPFFGPFIGAIPSALIILMVSPAKCLIFVIFIIILQQLDGNVIKPKILGTSVGINGFWVMFSIILFGGLFGFWGMLLGVPIWVCLFTGIKELVNRKLKRSELPTEPAAYMNLDYIDAETNEAVHR